VVTLLLIVAVVTSVAGSILLALALDHLAPQLLRIESAIDRMYAPVRRRMDALGALYERDSLFRGALLVTLTVGAAGAVVWVNILRP
jgi:hypothetical protein